jgi:xylulokinase
MRTHPDGAAGGAVGAARLAWLADGGDEGDVCRVPEISAEFTPESAEASLLRSRHDRFRSLYPALCGQFGSRRAPSEAAALTTHG